MAKFVTATLIDGSMILYETLTSITWRTERIDGKHSGIAISNTNYIMEVCHEGIEHKMVQLINREQEKMIIDLQEARAGFAQSTY